MNVKAMLRAYVEQRPQPGRRPICLREKQSTGRKLRGNAVLDWLLDFEKALSALEPQERILLTLVHGAGYRFSEAAALTGMKQNRMKDRLEGAETRLQAILEGRTPPPPRHGPGRPPRAILPTLMAVA